MKQPFFGEEYCDLKRKKPGHPKLNTLGDLYGILRRAWCRETASFLSGRLG